VSTANLTMLVFVACAAVTCMLICIRRQPSRSPNGARRLTSAQIRAIPLVRQDGTESEADLTCAVCLDDYTLGLLLRLLPCRCELALPRPLPLIPPTCLVTAAPFVVVRCDTQEIPPHRVVQAPLPSALHRPMVAAVRRVPRVQAGLSRLVRFPGLLPFPSPVRSPPLHSLTNPTRNGDGGIWGDSRAEHTSFDAPPLSTPRRRSSSRSDHTCVEVEPCSGGGGSSGQGGGTLACAPGDARRVEDAQITAAVHHHERGVGPHDVPTTLL